MVHRIQLSPRVRGNLVAALVLAVPAAAILMGCGGGGGVTSQRRTGQPLVPGSAEFAALLPAGQAGATNVGSQECARCHGPQQTTTVVRQGDIHTSFSQTTHARVGVGCESCHGPGSAHASSNGDKTKILTFSAITSAVVCSQCHGGIHQEWTLSKHDDVVAGPVRSTSTGNTTCGRCHSSQYHIEVLEKGRAPGDPGRFAQEKNTAACALCHDPHKKTGNLNDDGKEVQLRHAVFNPDTTQVGPGATVDQYSTFNHICAQCHNGRGANPSDAALTQGTSRPNMHDSNQFNMLAGFGGVDEGNPIRSQAHFNAPGQCSTCHMFDGLGRHTYVVKLDSCVPCHTPSDAAARRNAIRGDTEQRLLALRNRMERWAQSTLSDKDLWDYTSLLTEEGKTPPDQNLVPIQIKRARHNYYFVIRDASVGSHNGTYTRNLLDVANRNLDQLGVSAASIRSIGSGRAILEADRKRASRADARDWER